MFKLRKIISKGTAILTSLAMLMSVTAGIAGNTLESKAADYGISSPRVSDDGLSAWDKIKFGKYMQNIRFEKQPIKWRILSMNEDGTDAFVIADKALDSKPYNSNGNKIVVGKKDDEDDDYDSYYDYSCTWSNSTLREWLNSEFINEAFNKNEQAAIIKSTIKTEGEEDAEDKVFIISQKEARDTGYGYGMPSHEESYYYPRVLATNYAGVNGAWVDNAGKDVKVTDYAEWCIYYAHPSAFYTVFAYKNGKSLEKKNKLGVKVKGSKWKYKYYPKQYMVADYSNIEPDYLEESKKNMVMSSGIEITKQLATHSQ